MVHWEAYKQGLLKVIKGSQKLYSNKTRLYTHRGVYV